MRIKDTSYEENAFPSLVSTKNSENVAQLYQFYKQRISNRCIGN